MNTFSPLLFVRYNTETQLFLLVLPTTCPSDLEHVMAKIIAAKKTLCDLDYNTEDTVATNYRL